MLRNGKLPIQVEGGKYGQLEQMTLVRMDSMLTVLSFDVDVVASLNGLLIASGFSQ